MAIITTIPTNMVTTNPMKTIEKAVMEIKAAMKTKAVMAIKVAMRTKETTIKVEATTTVGVNLMVNNKTIRHLNTEMVHIDQSETPATLKLQRPLMAHLLQLKAMININNHQLTNIKRRPINTPHLLINTPQLQTPTALNQIKATSTRIVPMP